VVEGADLLNQARARLKSILAQSPLAVLSIMEAIDVGYDLSLPDALHLEAVHFAKVCASQDKQEGVSAFLNKRPPAFKGA
jgi:enoyl-CoA hydratase